MFPTPQPPPPPVPRHPPPNSNFRPTKIPLAGSAFQSAAATVVAQQSTTNHGYGDPWTQYNHVPPNNVPWTCNNNNNSNNDNDNNDNNNAAAPATSYGAFVPGFGFSTSQQQARDRGQMTTGMIHLSPATPASALPQPPKKARRHRKRHVPPGPAGLWFIQQKQKNAVKREGANDRDEDEEEEDDENGGGGNKNDKKRREPPISSNFHSPAWNAMQCHTHWYSPYVPSNNIQERYRLMKPHTPQHLFLIPDIWLQLEHQQTWKVPEIMVLVDHVMCHHWLLWTVRLVDETGASIRAWLDPELVQEEQKNFLNDNHHHHLHSEQSRRRKPLKKCVQEGFVWHLVNCSVMLRGQQHDDDDQEGHLHDHLRHHTHSLSLSGHHHDTSWGGPERMLMIGRDNIQQVWTPEEAHEIPDDEYCAWLEKKNAVEISQSYMPVAATDEGLCNSASAAPTLHLDARSQRREAATATTTTTTAAKDNHSNSQSKAHERNTQIQGPSRSVASARHLAVSSQPQTEHIQDGVRTQQTHASLVDTVATQAPAQHNAVATVSHRTSQSTQDHVERAKPVVELMPQSQHSCLMPYYGQSSERLLQGDTESIDKPTQLKSTPQTLFEHPLQRATETIDNDFLERQSLAERPPSIMPHDPPRHSNHTKNTSGRTSMEKQGKENRKQPSCEPPEEGKNRITTEPTNNVPCTTNPVPRLREFLEIKDDSRGTGDSSKFQVSPPKSNTNHHATDQGKVQQSRADDGSLDSSSQHDSTETKTRNQFWSFSMDCSGDFLLGDDDDNDDDDDDNDDNERSHGNHKKGPAKQTQVPTRPHQGSPSGSTTDNDDSTELGVFVVPNGGSCALFGGDGPDPKDLEWSDDDDDDDHL